MIKVLKNEYLNPQDDVVYNNPAIVLYASGCKWHCKYCHSKSTWDFNQGYYIDVRDVKPKLDDIVNDIEITIVGQGGDFYFQFWNWIMFIKEIRKVYGDKLKVVWSTGAKMNELMQKGKEYNYDYKDFDAILSGRPFHDENELNRKVLFQSRLNKQEHVIITLEGQLKPDSSFSKI